MKRFLLAACVLATAVGASQAATIIVDLACPVNGNGSGGYTAVCDASQAGNPLNDLQAAFNLALAGNDHIQLRGVHATHDAGGCPGSTTGQYEADRFRLISKSGSSGAPIFIEGYNYGVGGQEFPFISSVAPVTWIQCSTCDGADNVACQSLTGLPSSCSQYWYAYPTGNQDRAYVCTKTDGSPCYRLPIVNDGGSLANNKGDMTNAHSGYVGTFCANYPWLRCNSNSDCPDHLSCGGNSPEVDSVSSTESSGAYIVARWNAEGRGEVYYNNNGNAIELCNSSWVTIRGIHFRNSRRTLISIGDSGDGGCVGASDNVTVTNNTFAYTNDSGGSDYQVTFTRVTNGTVTDNYFAYSNSESIHSQTKSGGTVLTIQRNMIRDNGDFNVLGPRLGASGYGTGRTPECMTIAYDGANKSYAGTDISNNVLLRCHKNGILLEGIVDPVVHDNFIYNSGRSAVKISTEGNSVSGHIIFNNVAIGFGQYTNGDGGVWASTQGAGSVDNVKIYNNTFYAPASGTPAIKALNEAITNFIVRNNIMDDGGTNQKMVDFAATSGTNLLEYNLIKSGVSPAITWAPLGGGNQNCSTLSSAGTGNINNCPDPLFLNVAGFELHLNNASPARNAGTSTGMPTGKTTDVCNTMASVYGLPSYADCQAIQESVWDIGADEISAGGPPLPAHQVIVVGSLCLSRAHRGLPVECPGDVQ